MMSLYVVLYYFIFLRGMKVYITLIFQEATFVLVPQGKAEPVRRRNASLGPSKPGISGMFIKRLLKNFTAWSSSTILRPKIVVAPKIPNGPLRMRASVSVPAMRKRGIANSGCSFGSKFCVCGCFFECCVRLNEFLALEHYDAHTNTSRIS